MNRKRMSRRKRGRRIRRREEKRRMGRRWRREDRDEKKRKKVEKDGGKRGCRRSTMQSLTLAPSFLVVLVKAVLPQLFFFFALINAVRMSPTPVLIACKSHSLGPQTRVYIYCSHEPHTCVNCVQILFAGASNTSIYREFDLKKRLLLSQQGLFMIDYDFQLCSRTVFKVSLY